MNCKVGIIGGSGYVAGELIRLLLHHPFAQIDYIYSRSKAGKMVPEVHADLIGECTLPFSSEYHWQVDVLFLCSGHGKSREFMDANEVPSTVQVIDLSADFRTDPAFTYGLPEKNGTHYTSRIANPGCFATAIELALLPLASESLLQGAVHVHAITGSTGAGQKLSPTSHFSWREDNISMYKPFVHQHLEEIYQCLGTEDKKPDFQLNMLPLRGPFARGIFASLYFHLSKEEEDVKELFEAFYENVPFVGVSSSDIHLKQVVNTNKCLLHVQKIEGKLLVTSVIDNLLKGAAGQAVQNMNILNHFPQKAGLLLKASAF